MFLFQDFEHFSAWCVAHDDDDDNDDRWSTL